MGAVGSAEAEGGVVDLGDTNETRVEQQLNGIFCFFTGIYRNNRQAQGRSIISI